MCSTLTYFSFRLVVESKGKIFPNLSTKTTVNNNGERLKPPPSCINTERKIIKLGSVSKSSSTGLDFLIGKKDDSEVSEEKESNKKQKLLKEKRKTQCEEETKMKKIKVNHEENEAVLPVSNYYCILIQTTRYSFHYLGNHDILL